MESAISRNKLRCMVKKKIYTRTEIKNSYNECLEKIYSAFYKMYFEHDVRIPVEWMAGMSAGVDLPKL